MTFLVAKLGIRTGASRFCGIEASCLCDIFFRAILVPGIYLVELREYHIGSGFIRIGTNIDRSCVFPANQTAEGNSTGSLVQCFLDGRKPIWFECAVFSYPDRRLDRFACAVFCLILTESNSKSPSCAMCVSSRPKATQLFLHPRCLCRFFFRRSKPCRCSQGSGRKQPREPFEQWPRVCVAVGVETPSNGGCEFLYLTRATKGGGYSFCCFFTHLTASPFIWHVLQWGGGGY